MQKRFAPKHGRKVLANSLEHFLNRSRVPDKSGGHFQTFRWDIADGRFDVVRDPFDKVGRVFVFDVEKLFVDFFGRHAASE